MGSSLDMLAQGIHNWRSKRVGDYWIRADYIGSELYRIGDHTLTYVDGTLWHLWHGEWREIKAGSDFWLLSVPGAFAWTRDMIQEVGDAEDALQIKFNPDYGYVEALRVKMPERDAANFTFEVKDFGVGAHKDFKA